MLIWLWITSFLVLLGAALNAELEARLPELRKARKPVVADPDTLDTASGKEPHTAEMGTPDMSDVVEKTG